MTCFLPMKAAQNRSLKKVVTLNPAEISDFPNHPFKVKQDEAMAEMVDSIRNTAC